MTEDDDQKLEFLDRVLELDPSHANAMDGVATIYAARSRAAFEEAKQSAMAGDQAKAIEILDAFLKDVPDSVEAWTLKSHLSPSLEQKIEALEKAIEIDPENAAARSGLAFLALTFGANKDAGEHAVQPSPSVEAEAADEPSTDRYDDPAQSFAPEDSFEVQPTQESFKMAAEDGSDEFSGPVHISLDAQYETVDSFSPFESKVTEDIAVEPAAVEYSAPLDNARTQETFFSAENQETVIAQAHSSTCPFCGSANEPQSFDCGNCNARLTLSDIEALLIERDVNRDFLRDVVTEMEAEWNLREFNEDEMVNLGLGHLNLGDTEVGLKYLQEASRLDSNNVILAGQVNALAIRMDEINRQNEVTETRLTRKRILVVDDSPTVRKLISGKLEKSGHVVVCASDGVEALEQLESDMPDLVLLDITMPRMDGYEVCKQIRSNPQGKHLPVVMISGKDGFFDKVRGRMAGSTGYVTKPFGPETLMKALETYLVPEG